jgi:hypothetical protein
MPVFQASAPLTHAQKRRRWIAAGVIVVATVGFAVWAAIDCARIAFGYVASYSFATVFMLSCILAVAGALLMIYWRTRSTGAALFGAAVVMYLVFLGCIETLKKFDKVAWQHEPPMRSFGPDQQASMVIYYRPGTNDKQIEDFVEHKLENYPSKVHDGKDFPEFVTEYMALSPSQANGFEGSALTFKPDTNGVALDNFISMVQSDPRVALVFRDVVPNEIHLSKAERVAISPIDKPQENAPH